MLLTCKSPRPATAATPNALLNQQQHSGGSGVAATGGQLHDAGGATVAAGRVFGAARVARRDVGEEFLQNLAFGMLHVAPLFHRLSYLFVALANQMG